MRGLVHDRKQEADVAREHSRKRTIIYVRREIAKEEKEQDKRRQNFTLRMQERHDRCADERSKQGAGGAQDGASRGRRPFRLGNEDSCHAYPVRVGKVEVAV